MHAARLITTRMRWPIAAALIVAALVGMSTSAQAQPCPTSVNVTPSPGWIGGPIKLSGSGWAPGVDIFVNLDGKQLGSTTTNSSGVFSLSTTIPGNVATGSVLLFVQDGPANCEVQQQHTVLAQAPTTTTTTVTTTTTSTTEPPVTTTTAAAPATAPTASTATVIEPPPTTTISTSAAPQITTLAAVEAQIEGVAGDQDGGGGDSALIAGLVGAIIGAALLGGAILLGRRTRPGD